MGALDSNGSSLGLTLTHRKGFFNFQWHSLEYPSDYYKKDDSVIKQHINLVLVTTWI